MILDQHKPDPSLVLQTLEVLLTKENPEQARKLIVNGSYQIVKLIDYLHEATELDITRIMGIEWNFLPLLLHSQTRPKRLFGALAEQPAFFVQTVKMAYQRKSDGRAEESTHTNAKIELSQRARDLLDNWHYFPGADGENIDEQKLRTWVDEVRAVAKSEECEKLATYRVGELFAHAPGRRRRSLAMYFRPTHY